MTNRIKGIFTKIWFHIHSGLHNNSNNIFYSSWWCTCMYYKHLIKLLMWISIFQRTININQWILLHLYRNLTIFPMKSTVHKIYNQWAIYRWQLQSTSVWKLHKIKEKWNIMQITNFFHAFITNGYSTKVI